VDVTNTRVLDVVKSQVLNDIVDVLVLLLFAPLQLQTGRKCKGLVHGEVREQDIVLHNVGGVSGECLLVNGDAVVKQNISRYLCLVDQSDTIGKDIQQRSLSSSRSTHDVGGLAGGSITRAFFADLLALDTATCLGLLCLGAGDLDLEEDLGEGNLDGVLAL